MPSARVDLQPPPPAPTPPSTTAVSFLLPVIGTIIGLGGTVFAVSGSGPEFLLLSVPVVLVSYLAGAYTFIHDREKHRREVAERHTAYDAYLAERRQTITALVEQQRRASLLPHPTPEVCLQRAETRDRRLWERSPVDADFMDLRLGTGDSPALCAIKAPPVPHVTLNPDPLLFRAQALADESRLVAGCAVTLPMAQLGAIGVVGPRAQGQSRVRSMLIQAATHHAPTELKIVLTFPADEAPEWEWARWLPHVWNDDRTRRYLASSREEQHALLEELADTLRQRQPRDRAATRRDEAPPVPFFLIVFADLELFHGSSAGSLGPALQLLLNDGPQVGAASIFLSERLTSVPKECRAIVDLTDASPNLRLVGPPPSETTFTADDVSVPAADRFARLLAPLRVQRLAGSGAIPRMATLLDTLGAQRPEELPILDLWQQSEPHRSLAAPIGLGAGGAPLALDLHENGHGPHGLMAGMTGAGKSELLQSLVASLGVHFHPHEVAFVLIDYKGGGMANAFRELPHQIGIITNLGGNLTDRALASLRAELQRRQRLFAQTGVTRIDRYLTLQRQGKAPEPLPHLVIITDEFAELRQNQPDFMAQLISAVRVGRSLGLHLLLATQKPSGVVTDEIWANSNFRVCLRVQSPEDSREMLKRPDAAAIPREQRGRGYFQVGMNEIFEPFQSAYAGAPYLPDQREQLARTDLFAVDLNGRRLRLTTPDTGLLNAAPSEPHAQLDVVVARIRDVAAAAGIERTRGFWLPPLPETVTLDEIRPAAGWDGAGWQPVETRLSPVIGLLDDPGQQAQRPLRLDLGHNGHMAVYGAPGSGKTTLLQTLILSLALDHPPDDLQVYILDFGGRLLTQLRDLPHVGGVILPDETERIQRLMRSLLAELERRKTRFAQAGIGTIASFREQMNEAPPHLLIVVDNYKDFADAFPAAADDLARIASQGANLGFHLVVTTHLVMGIPTRLLSNIALTVALELNDPSEYLSIVGRTEGLIPARGTRGRGLVRSAPPLEFQTAFPVPGETSGERTVALRALIEQTATAWSGPLPAPVRVLPTEIPLSELMSPDAPPRTDAGSGVPLGLGAENLEPVTIQLDDGPHFLITGPPTSGKTTMLQTWLLALAATLPPERVSFYLAALGGRAFQPFRALPHVAAYIDDDQGFGVALETIRQEIRNRQAQGQATAQPTTPTLAGDQTPPLLVLALDDFDQARTLLCDANKTLLETILRSGRRLGCHVLIAGPSSEFASSWDPIGKAIKEQQTGFVLGSTDHADIGVFNLRLPSDQTGKTHPPGRGLAIRRTRWQSLQIATCQAGSITLQDWVARIVNDVQTNASHPPGPPR